MRKRIPLNQNWEFSHGERGTNNAWEAVTLPHPLSVTPANSSGGRNLQETACYRTRLSVAAEELRKSRFELTLEGVMGISLLWVNGIFAGEHRCGYTPFITDITAFLHEGDDNLIEVQADNRDNPEVPPGTRQDMLDFTYEGGIYRSAWLTVTGEVFITSPLLENKPAGGGIFVWTENVSRESAEVLVQTHLRNRSAQPFRGLLICSLQNKAGEIAARADENAELSADGEATATVRLTVHKPVLWSPEDPSLYTLRVSLLLEAGEMVDELVQMVGIRDFTYTCDRGMVWNGEPRRISGANYHAAWPCIGNAVPENLLRRDVRRLRRIGMKNLRSHYPFSEAFLDECDRQGMTVIVSNPGWQWFLDGRFAEQMEKNMREIIRWQRNHPCIILWEPLPNETELPEKWQKRYLDLVREEYPHSPCFTASDHAASDVSYRLFDPGMLKPGMEGYDPEFRYGEANLPVWIREYGDWPDNWTDQSCAWRTPRAWGEHAMLRAVSRLLGEDPQCTIRTYLEMYNRKELCGYGIWPGIEHNRGYHVNPCWGGFFDLFRVPKFTAWFLDCQQEIAEAGVKLYIANWWTDVSPEDVTIFSNAEKIRLFHNGQLVGEREPEPIAVAHPPFRFPNIRRFRTRDRSLLTAQAIVNGQVVGETYVRTPGKPAALLLETDLQDIPFGPNGEDMIAVHCVVVDEEGGFVPLAGDDHPIRFLAESGCKIMGDASTGANPQFPRGGIASILIRSLGSGPVRLRAEMAWPQTVPGLLLRPAVLELSCRI